VERLEENKFWLCVTEDGAIFLSGDLVGDRDIVSARLSEIMFDFSGREVKTYDKHKVFLGAEQAIQLDFADLTKDSIANTNFCCRPLQSSSRRIPLLAMVICLTLLVSTYGIWNFWLSSPTDDSLVLM